MKIAFNPSTVAALTSPPKNNDITFDLKGRNIFARGVKFSGTDTQVNVIDNLISTATSSALSANMGRLLNLIKTPYNNTSTPSNAPSAYNIEICPTSSGYYSSLNIPDSGGGLLIRGHTGTAFNLWLHDTSNVWYKKTADGNWKKMDAGQADNADMLDGYHASAFASSSHNHDGRYVYNYGGTDCAGASLGSSYMGMTTSSGIDSNWWHIISAGWNGEYRWNSQIGFPTQSRNGFYYRSGKDDNTGWGSWVKLLDANNFNTFHHLLTNGSTTVATSTWTNPFSTYDKNNINDGLAICVWGQSAKKYSDSEKFSTDTGDISLWLRRVNSNTATLNMVIDGNYYASGFVNRGSSNDYVLLGGGSTKQWTTGNTANTLVARDANGYIYTSYINTSIGTEDSGTVNYIYYSYDNWIRKMSYSRLKTILNSDLKFGNYLPLSGGTMAGTAYITFADSGSWSAGTGALGARGGIKWSGQSDYAWLYAEETTGDNLDLVIKFGDDNSNGLSIRNVSNVLTTYISAGGVISTGTFKGNLDWSYITNKPSFYTKTESDAKYVTSLGTNGRYLTWTKNNTTNNITVPFATYSSALKSTGDDGNWYNWVYWNGSYFWLKAGTSIYDNNTATLKTAVDYSTAASYVLDNGVHAETSSGTTANDSHAGMLYSSGMYMTRTYAASNMPTYYGNVLNLAGGGSSLLLLGWSGSDSTTGNIYYRSHRDTSSGGWGAWATILATNNYAGILDSRYYTESEVNTLLSKKLDRVNLTTGSWNPRGYNLAADYHYNGGDVSFAESSGLMHVSIDGKFWQNEGLYRVLDTSDLSGIYSNVTLNLHLSNSDTAWWPIVWGGSSHNNTNNSTGQLYKSYNALTWQTSSQTLYATKMATNLIGINSMSSLYLGNNNSPTVGGALSNLVILTWYGVSFTSNCCGTYAGKTGVGIDARLGIIRAANYEGNWHGYINQLYQNNTSDTWVPVLNNSYLLHRVIPAAYNNDPSTLNVNSALYLSTVKFDHGPDSNTWHKILTFTTNWVGQVTFMYAPEECQRYYWFIGLINVRNGDPYFFITACTGTYPTMKVIGTDSTHWELWIKGNSGSYDPYGALSILSFSNASITGRGIMASLTSEPSGTYNKTPSNYLNAYISNYVRDYNDSTHVILVGFRGSGLTTSNLSYLAGYTSDGNSIKDVSKDVLKSWIGIDNYYWADVKISTSSNTQTQPSVNTIYANNWFRSQGSTGWYSESYGGGIYMYDSTWVRVFNNKGFYTENEIQANQFRANNTNGCYLFGNSNAKISHIDDQVIFNTGAAIRFGSTAWDWNLWAGLKYDSSNKCVYLGIADGSVFNANSSLSGGIINLRAGISTIEAPNIHFANTTSGLCQGLLWTCGDNDYARIKAGATSSNAGYLEIATADDGTEPIYVRQYSGTFSTIKRTLTLLDGNGYSYFPSYINIGGNENNNSSPDRVWGSNGSDSFLRSYRTSALRVAYANTTSYASSAGNADKVDGKHASEFASSSHNHDGRYAVSENYGGFTRTGRLPISGFYQSYESTSGGNAPWTSWVHLINCQHSNTANNYALQIAASFYDNNTFKIRVTNGNVDNTWRNIIHSGNIGSQSVSYASSAGNADKVDGYHVNDPSVLSTRSKPFGKIPVVYSDGVMEVGRYLDFHYDNTSNTDFSTRLYSEGNYLNYVRLPSSSGTLALTSLIPTIKWAIYLIDGDYFVKLSGNYTFIQSATLNTNSIKIILDSKYDIDEIFINAIPENNTGAVNLSRTYYNHQINISSTYAFSGYLSFLHIA